MLLAAIFTTKQLYHLLGLYKRYWLWLYRLKVPSWKQLFIPVVWHLIVPLTASVASCW